MCSKCCGYHTGQPPWESVLHGAGKEFVLVMEERTSTLPLQAYSGGHGRLPNHFCFVELKKAYATVSRQSTVGGSEGICGTGAATMSYLVSI